MRALVLAAAIAALSAAEPQGGWKRLVGQEVPPIAAKSWMNTGEETPGLDTLKGKVWLIEFFATT